MRFCKPLILHFFKLQRDVFFLGSVFYIRRWRRCSCALVRFMQKKKNKKYRHSRRYPEVSLNVSSGVVLTSVLNVMVPHHKYPAVSHIQICVKLNCSNCWLFQLNSHPHRLHLGTHFNTICFSVWKCIQRLVCLNEIFFLIHWSLQEQNFALPMSFFFFYNHVIIYIHEPGKIFTACWWSPYNSYSCVPLTVCRTHISEAVDRFCRYVRLIT